MPINPLTGKDYDTGPTTDPAALAGTSWDVLNQMRQNYATDPQAQQMLAPYEHRAYARETVQANPALAPIMAQYLVPGYQAYKGVGLGTNDGDNVPRTGASWDQFKQGEIGTAEGLYAALAKKLQSP